MINNVVKKMRNYLNSVLLRFIPLVLVIIYGCNSSIKEDSNRIIADLEESLKRDLLAVWYPISLDTVYGGFLCDFTYDWQAKGRQNKMLVTQSRHLWTTSQSAIFYQDDRYRKMAEHGYRFLKKKMWDTEYGGFYMLRNQQGNAIQEKNIDYKSAYGNAFAIYALAAYFALTGDSSALDLAQETFFWLEKHSHDSESKGYFDRMNLDGSLKSPNRSNQGTTKLSISTWKDQNSSIHLLEAFTSLYQIWPHDLLRERLLELYVLIRDKITTEKGYLTLFFSRDWTPVSFRDSSNAVREANYFIDHVSFGHDVETAYLMLEASQALQIESVSNILRIAKKMVDHALAKGWDRENGGFYHQGYYFKESDSISIINEKKIWWVQAEGLNALLLMSKLFPEEKKYYHLFIQQWNYIKKFMIDHEYGGWYAEGLDKSPEHQKAPKAHAWKVNYHNFRALVNCINMLKSDHKFLF
jgi:mannobiose 2-epimerase